MSIETQVEELEDAQRDCWVWWWLRTLSIVATFWWVVAI